ncbi:hypothetical protein [Kingella negevensis]|nr:hypothetical protein [Kingella negevensis]MDK4687770.1 hypothetical protein [Kingella negevensis]
MKPHLLQPEKYTRRHPPLNFEKINHYFSRQAADAPSQHSQPEKCPN